MATPRERAWEQLEEEYSNTVAHKIARFGLDFDYDSLPEDVRHMGKRCLLDAIGCAIGGHAAPGRAICEKVATALGGAPEATVIGSGLKTNALNASMVNAFMIRYLDYNDLAGGGHNSDAVAALLAVGETEKSNGALFMRALILTYELGMRVLLPFLTDDPTADYKRFTGRGWCTDVRGGATMPPALGLMMGLSEEQVANAIGATLMRSLPSNHLDANDEEFVMSKNLRFGWVGYDSIMSCRLAREGFTGPRRAFEGEYGFSVIFNGGPGEYDRATDPSDHYHIMDSCFKPLCVNYTTQSGVQCTIALCKEHDIKPEDVESVHITCCAREAVHTTYLAKKYPRNGESADHSLFYANALAIIERGFGPKSFKQEKFTDPMVQELTERITFSANDEWPGFSNAGGSAITLKDGRVFEKVLEEPYGHSSNPISDAALEEKFREMADEHFKSSEVDRLVDAIWSADQMDDIGDLARMLVFTK